MTSMPFLNPNSLKVYVDGKLLKGVTGFQFVAIPKGECVVGRISYAYLQKDIWGITERSLDVVLEKMNSRVVRLTSDKYLAYTKYVEEGMPLEEIQEFIEKAQSEERTYDNQDGECEGPIDDEDDDEDEEEPPAKEEEEEDDENFFSTLGQNP